MYYQIGHESNSSYASLFGRLYLSGVVVSGSDDGHFRTASLLNEVIGGRYYNGKTYISATVSTSLKWSNTYFQKRKFSAEYEIVDGKISNIRILMNIKTVDTGDDELIDTSDDKIKSEYNSVTTLTYTYGGQVVEGVPSDTAGYTQSTNASIKLLGQ